MVDRRRLVAVVALLALAAAVLWTASLLVWTWRVDVAGGTAVVTEQRGAQAEPAIAGLALVALAAVAGVLATGGWLRRGIGVLVLAAGAGALVLAWRGLKATRTVLSGDFGFERWIDEVDRWSAQATTALVLTALAGVLLLAAGTVVVLTGHRMPRMGSRYQRRAGPDTAPAAGPDAPPGAAGRSLWDELDAGRDPTDR